MSWTANLFEIVQMSNGGTVRQRDSSIVRFIPGTRCLWRESISSVSSFADNQPETEVVASYLALLLSKIITAVPSALSEISDALPGDDTESKLGRIVGSLRALDTYRSTLQRTLKEETGTEGVEWQEDGNEVKKAIDDMLGLVDIY
jgi:hypothetical protein